MDSPKEHLRSLRYADLHAASTDAGLAILAVTSADDLGEEAGRRLEHWQRAGYAGEMKYMQRDSSLFLSPQSLLASARSIIVFAAPYATSPHPPLREGFARVARYAWGMDYHDVLAERVARLLSRVRS